MDKKRRPSMTLDLLLSSGSQTRTDDLWVMSPTSCHCSIPQFASAKLLHFPDVTSKLTMNNVFFNIFLLKTIAVSTKNTRCGAPNQLENPATGVVKLSLKTGVYRPIFLKKSLPLLSTRMKAGKSTTRIFHTASIPNSGYSTHSILLMLSCDRMAAGPPMLPR